MAGRIRSIKPEFLEDEKLGAMSAVTRLLFACTWLMADDYGNFRANPKWVHSQAFCFDEQTSVGVIRDSLAELTGAGMLTLYWVRGQSYYHVTNWAKHQRVDKPGKPHCPGQDEAETTRIEPCGIDSRDSSDTVAGQSVESRVSLAPDRDQRPTTNDQRPPQSEKIPCPSDLRLTDDQRGALETSMIPGWAIDAITVSFVATAVADQSDRRPFIAWQKCLSKAIAGQWNDSKRRPKNPANDPEKPKGGKPGEVWHPGGYWYFPPGANPV